MAKIDQQLESCFTEHLPYEIRMMRYEYSKMVALNMIPKAPSVELEMNSAIEGFCLHARNLMEFFKNKSDFDPREFTVRGYPLNKRFLRDSFLSKLNAQLTHLSSRRTSDPKEKLHGPDFDELKRAIEAEISRMIENLKPEWRSKCTFGDASAVIVQLGSSPSSTNYISSAASVVTDVRTVGS